MLTRFALVSAVAALAACAPVPGEDANAGGALGNTPGGPADAATGRNIASTDVEVDLSTLRATAHVRFEAGPEPTARLELTLGSDAKILRVTGTAKILGAEILLEGLPAADAQIAVEYTLQPGNTLRLSNSFRYSEATLSWPNRCSQLFPCHSSPEDAGSFTLDLRGVPDGMTAVFPSSLPDVAAYQLAWAVGKYTYISGGSTAAGTEVGIYTLSDPSDEYLRNNLPPTLDTLRRAFDRLEQTYGAYRFGNKVAAVEIDTFQGAVSGMEHHPLWHVASGALLSTETQIHEAIHGWFGDGVRIRCWEDLVLSEGVTSYLTSRTRIAIGDIAEADAWALLASDVNDTKFEELAAWPSGCRNTTGTFNENGLPHYGVYSRGAQFLREVARTTGADALDGALADFYRARNGKAAGVQDLIAQIKTSTGFDADPLATTWLRGKTTPEARP